MPQALSFAAVWLSSFAGTTALANAIYYGVYGLAFAGVYAAQRFLAPDMPKPPTPEDGKFNLKQNVPYMPFVLGRVSKGSDYALLEEKNGDAYHVLIWAGHQINGFTEHWLHDEQVTINNEGWVTEPPNFRLNGYDLVNIDTRLGAPASTAYEDVVAAMPTIWTEDHRGDGLATIRMSVRTVSAENYQKAYPQQMPQHSAVGEGALLFDPRTGTTAYSDNLALERLWHITHPVGCKLTMDDMYLPDWINVANVCDQLVTNREGVLEQRYHGGFWFRANNNPVDVGRIMDQAGEMVIYERPDGKVGVHAGEYVEPDIRLTEKDIIGVVFNANRSLQTNVLAVRGRFTDPTKRFNTVDAAVYGDPYVDDTERSSTFENQAVQSHNHCQRLQKIKFIRDRAPRVKIVADWHAARLVKYRRFVRVHMPPRMDEAVIEITGRPKTSLRNLTIEFEGIVIPGAGLYAFDAATEEGEPPADIEEVAGGGVPVPVNFNVVIKTEVVSGGQTAAYAEATWDFVSDALLYELEWTPTAGGTPQTARSVANESSVRSGYLADGTEYRFRLRTWSAASSSDWTEYQIRTATADPVAPGSVSNADLTGGVGEAEFGWTAPNSGNYFAARLYLNTADDFATATLVATEYGIAAANDARVITGLTADTYYGWVEAINSSGVPAAAMPTGSATVT